MNVTEIVRELKMTKEEFFPLAQQLGFDIGERAIKVDDQIAIKLITAIKVERRKINKRSLFEHEKKAEVVEPEKVSGDHERMVEVTDPITTKAFADVLGKNVTELIAVLVRNGIMATINQNLDYETVTIIAEDLGYKTKLVNKEEASAEADREAKMKSAMATDTSDNLQPRPPIIVVMGHVDHGKTSLLDALRETSVTSQEAGGITQTIGAYQINYKDRGITFIDTPGHEAFSAMRSRGANVADIAILVVAADDGIKPQTEEAIQILEKAELPFVVAINKMDKADADVEKVKKGLSELNLIPEDWGGKTICVPVSAKAKTNLDELLEMVLLVADMHKDGLTANPDRDPVGTIIESTIDKESGSMATVLVQTGKLRVGDIVEAGEVSGKIKAMYNWKGEPAKEAGPSMPVRFLGLKGAPSVGDILTLADKDTLKKRKKSYQTFGYLKATASSKVDNTNKDRLHIILKADTLGSLEAIVESLNKFSHDEVGIDIIKRGLGNFTEKDIDQAVAGKAQLIGFNVQPTPVAADYALSTQTETHEFSVIYKLIEYIEEELEKLLAPEIIYNKIGEIRIMGIFRQTQKNTIAGGRVTDGKVEKNTIVKVMRGGENIGEAKLVQLKIDQNDVKEVGKDRECGFKLETETKIEIDDVIEIYTTEEKKRTLKDVKK